MLWVKVWKKPLLPGRYRSPLVRQMEVIRSGGSLRFSKMNTPATGSAIQSNTRSRVALISKLLSLDQTVTRDNSWNATVSSSYQSGFIGRNRGVVHSQIGCTHFKSSKKFLRLFEFFRIFWIFRIFRIFWIFSDFFGYLIFFGFFKKNFRIFWIFGIFRDFLDFFGFFLLLEFFGIFKKKFRIFCILSDFFGFLDFFGCFKFFPDFWDSFGFFEILCFFFGFFLFFPDFFGCTRILWVKRI